MRIRDKPLVFKEWLPRRIGKSIGWYVQQDDETQLLLTKMYDRYLDGFEAWKQPKPKKPFWIK